MRRTPEPGRAGTAAWALTTLFLPGLSSRFGFVFNLIDLYPAILPAGETTHLKEQEDLFKVLWLSFSVCVYRIAWK